MMNTFIYGLFLFVTAMLISLCINVIPSGMFYLIINKALGFNVSFWFVYWLTFLVVSLSNIIGSHFKNV